MVNRPMRVTRRWRCHIVMNQKNEADPIQTIRDRINKLEAQLQDVMQERSKVEADIADGLKQMKQMQERSSEIDAEEGKLRQQLGDLKRSLDALEQE